LPFYTADVVWHDLQFHRGSHPKYNDLVSKKANEIQEACREYCKTGDQMKIWHEIEGCVQRFRKKILNWTIPLHGNSENARTKEFKERVGCVPAKGRNKYYF